MRWTSRDRLLVERDMRELTNNYTKVVCLIPIIVDSSNYDPMEDSALDPTNTNTEVTGQVISWQVREIHLRIAGPTFTDLMLSNGQGLEKGDLNVFVRAIDIPIVREMLKNNDAYFWINGQYYKIYGTEHPAGVFGKNEFTFNLKSTTPRINAPGY